MKKLIFLAMIAILVLSACSANRQKLSPQGNLNLKSANVYYAQHNADKALDFYQKVLKDNPDYYIALKRVADINLLYGEQNAAKDVEYNTAAYTYYD